MTRTLLASAAFIVFASGIPSVSFAADEPLSAAAVTSVDAVKARDFRRIAVEPKAIVAEPRIAITPEGTASQQLVVNPEGSPSTGVQQIVVNPEGTPSGNDDKSPVLEVPPGPVASGNNPIGPIDVAETTPEQPAPQFEKPLPPVEETAPQAAPETDLGQTEEAPAPTGQDAVRGATALYDLLTARGYEVEILKNDGYGRYVFKLTRDGSYTANLLLVDGYTGEVIQRKDIRVAGYDNGYSAPAPTHRYTPAYSQPETYDNCETDYGYQASRY